MFGLPLQATNVLMAFQIVRARLDRFARRAIEIDDRERLSPITVNDLNHVVRSGNVHHVAGVSILPVDSIGAFFTGQRDVVQHETPVRRTLHFGQLNENPVAAEVDRVTRRTEPAG